MRTPPSDLAERAVVDTVAAGWGIDLRDVAYQPVGFGSHHWLGDGGEARWWITVDDLAARSASRVDGPPSVTDRSDDNSGVLDALRAAMAVPRALGDAGYGLVVAPVRTIDGEVVARVDAGYAAVVHPVIDGRSHEWADVLDPPQIAAVVELLADLHRVPRATVPATTRLDTHRFDHRNQLESVVVTSSRGSTALAVESPAVGPYAARAVALVEHHRGAVAACLRRFDELWAAAGAGEPAARRVLTHGEPHPGNLIETADGWVLIDWDTALLAPPERDLWSLIEREEHRAGTDPAEDADSGPFDVAGHYERSGGVPLDRDLLAAYRLRWELADTAEYLRRFRTPHVGSPDDDEAFENLERSIARLHDSV